MTEQTRTAKLRIGFDMSILDRTQTGTSVYTEALFRALNNNAPEYMDIIGLRAPRPLASRNFFARGFNLALEIVWLMLLLPLQVRKKRIDVLHMPANVISPFVRVPQACTIHDAHFITNPEGRDPVWKLYARLTFRYAARHADVVINVTETARDQVIDLLGSDRSRSVVINHGITDRTAEAADLARTADLSPYILTVGATAPNKNIESLVKAFAQLHKAGDIHGYKLIVAGPQDRSHPALEEMVSIEGLANEVLLMGKVSDSRLAALYTNASLFVFPSLSEGFGLPPLEAMRHGVPVAASDAPCIPETLGDAALYFNPRDVSAIADAIRSIITDEAMQSDLRVAGTERASRFSWDRTASETINIYEKLATI